MSNKSIGDGGLMRTIFGMEKSPAACRLRAARQVAVNIMPRYYPPHPALARH